MTELQNMLSQALQEVADAADLQQLDQARVKYLGKQGQFTTQLKALGQMPAE